MSSTGGGSDHGKPSTNHDDFTKISWEAPGSIHHADSVSSKNATIALKTAIAVARAFDANCALRNPIKECTVPMFESQELSLGNPLRSSGFFTDFVLKSIELAEDEDLIHGAFGDDEQECRIRFMERTHDGPNYAAKFLQKGIYNSVHAASAASDMMMETKILMNLAPHPNICQIYGVTGAGSDAFLSQGKDGFFILIDCIQETLVHKIQAWRDQQAEERQKAQEKLQQTADQGGTEEDLQKVQHELTMLEYRQLMERLEVALDIGSALLFLSDRQLVFHLRPDKVGFDARYGRIKLCDFGQAREHGQVDQAPSLAKSDDIRTLAYTAPEVLCQAPVTVSADVYAYGIVLWELLSLQRPFDGMTRAEHFERVVMEDERPSTSEYRDFWPKAMRRLMDNCWDPHFRPTMKKVYDTVEETLLFQDDEAPTISTPSVPVLLPPNKGKIATNNIGDAKKSSKKEKGVRRTKSSDSGTAKPSKSGSEKKRASTKPKKLGDDSDKYHSSDPQIGRQGTKEKEAKRKGNDS